MKKKLRRTVAAALSVFLMAGVVLPVEANAQESPYDPITHLDDAYAYAYGGLLDLRLLGDVLSVANLQGVDQLWETTAHNEQGPRSSPVDLEVLELIQIGLGDVHIPLVGEDGLLEFALGDASVGALREYAHAPSAAHAHGAAGVVSDSGGLELTQPGQGKSASVDILSLLNLQGSEAITNTIIKEAALELGAISAVAINPDDSEFVDYNVTCDPELTATNISTDPDKPETICHGYQIADAVVVIDAPIVKNLMGTITNLINGLDTTIDGLLKSPSLITDLLGAVRPLIALLTLGLVNPSLEVTATVPVTNILTDLLTEELSDESGLVKIDLGEGLIKVDLAKIHTDGLNNLAPDTNLLTSYNIDAIIDSVLSLLTDDATTNPHGLMARLESAIIGDVDPMTGENLQTGGLYDTELEIILSNTGTPITGLGKGTLTIAGTLEELFSSQFDISGNGIFEGLNPLGNLVTTLTGDVGTIVKELLFVGTNSLVSNLVSSASDSLVDGLVDVLDPVLDVVLKPLANIIVNRQTTQQVAHGTVFTVSALEVNVLELGTQGELIHLPLATASVMAQPPVTMDFDVAKVGDGRNLYTDDYTYDLVCTLGEGENEREVVNKTGLQYGEAKVGDGFVYGQADPDEPPKLSLTGATGGLTDPIRISPGAQCTVTGTADTLTTAHPALRPTGTGDGTRTPYTYFLDVDAEDGVLVSGGTSVDGLTALNPIPMTSSGSVSPNTDNVGNEWKNHSFTFTVPAGKDIHRVSIVHAYDIDTRDITLSKTTTGPAPEGQSYSFQYSLDEGNPWLPQSPDSPISVAHGGSFTIKDVPVLDLQSLNAEPPTQVSTEIKIRELVELNSQHVTWELDGATLNSEYESDGTVQYALTRFTAGPVADAAIVPTTDMTVGVTNSYVEVSVDKHIDGLLSVPLSDTTLLPFGEDEMTIRYTVTTTENPGSVTLSDPSLNNDLFDLPAGFNVGTDGTIHDCTLTAVEGEDNTYSCEFTVTFSAPEAPFHYEAADAVVTATVTKTIDGRTVTATATDQHGAMRLPNIFGQLPATGVTTLVWVMALGLIAALTALALYVRSRRK